MTNTSKTFTVGQSVTITSPTDDTDAMHDGTVAYVTRDGWVGVTVCGESTTHEWPMDRVWA